MAFLMQEMQAKDTTNIPLLFECVKKVRKLVLSDLFLEPILYFVAPSKNAWQGCNAQRTKKE
jgi:hypothetical protein